MVFWPSGCSLLFNHHYGLCVVVFNHHYGLCVVVFNHHYGLCVVVFNHHYGLCVVVFNHHYGLCVVVFNHHYGLCVVVFNHHYGLCVVVFNHHYGVCVVVTISRRMCALQCIRSNSSTYCYILLHIVTYCSCLLSPCPPPPRFFTDVLPVMDWKSSRLQPFFVRLLDRVAKLLQRLHSQVRLVN